MKQVIKVKKSTNSEVEINAGVQTQGLLGRLVKLSDAEKNTLLTETTKILSNCINPISTTGSTTGIAIGYVQSGKTLSFTTLTALAVDSKFRIIIYFAGIKNNLLEQTTKRLKKDLLTEAENSRAFKVYQSPTIEDESHVKIKNALGLQSRPAILITVLKHYKHISELTKIFKSTEVRDELGNNGVLIIDDEADQASLNTYARKNSRSEDWEDDEFSSTYSSILDLRASIQNHSYIQYTATPQGPLLINIMDLLSPKFHVVLTPGTAYTGGKTFFIDNPNLIIEIPDEEVYHHKNNQLEECPQSLIDALQVFLIGVAIVVNIEAKEPYLSMMVHADRETDASKKFRKWVVELIDNWVYRLKKLPEGDPSRTELIAGFKDSYEEAVKQYDNPPTFETVIEQVIEVMLDLNIELVVAGAKEIDWSNSSAHILVGAEMLNRGYTVEGLMVSYMPRYNVGRSNADTIQQRCRFFGYKRNYLESCRVYLPADSIEEYTEYVEHEEIFRKNLKEQTLEELEQVLILDSSMSATRSNILSKDLVSNKLNGWRQMNALQHIDENIEFVEEILDKYNFKPFADYKTEDRNHRYIKLDIQEIIGFLKNFKIANMPDALRKSSTIQYLRYLAEHEKIKHGYLIQMAYQVVGGRERKLVDDENVLKINNIFSGRSTTGSDTYPGDKGIKFEDSLCIQIHKIRLKHDKVAWNNKVVYTLGIYYPEGFVHSFVGIQK